MRTLVAAILFLVLPSVATAQVASGTVNVVAEDSSGAVVPGASVTVTNIYTGIS